MQRFGHVEVSDAAAGKAGSLDPAIANRYVERFAAPKMHACFEGQLRTDPTLVGHVTARFTVAANGTVSKSLASGLNESVDQCVAGAIKVILFPRPKNRADAHLVFRIAFRID